MRGASAIFGARVLGSMSSGVVAIDTDRRIVILNDGARRILGGLPGDVDAVIGEPCAKVLGGQPAVVRLLVEALEAQSPLSRAELVLEAVGERGRSTIGLTLSPIHDADGRRCGAAMIFRDLTPFERMDEQDRLRERLAALGQMAADLAHEIRNPLAGMEVAAGLLLRRLADRPDERALVEQILGELRSLADTVTASLEFVKPVELERVALDPVELVDSAIAQALARVAFDGVIERNFGPDLPAIRADRNQLRSVFTNLVVNAFEAMGKAGGVQHLAVSLRCLASDRNVRKVRVDSNGRTTNARTPCARELELTLRDSGPGIPASLREKVFYPFFTTKENGSGIGLAAAQKIVTNHGGIIEIVADEAAGATFQLRLPIADDEPGDTAARRLPGGAP